MAVWSDRGTLYLTEKAGCQGKMLAILHMIKQFVKEHMKQKNLLVEMIGTVE